MINFSMYLSGNLSYLSNFRGEPIGFNNNLFNNQCLGMEKKLICLRGHERTPENLDTKSTCKTCKYLANTKYQNTVNGFKVKSEINKRSRLKNKLHDKARSLISNSIKSDLLTKFNFCSICGREGKTEFHHFNYDLDKTFKNIIEVCKSCHTGITHDV